ncbi:flagellar hook-associated protein FlgK [Telmatospirillum siberiense]|uniref:Flagellar hook-associated protein 1 n=1 Tax=Telmatospirillum siberiense TaxID=382514 RepID=A0A2N3Q018_9PROT|nr:flagellar hook-associated protein FlgK [Telmatospirillum siberiense]PKU26007.1 flagellar hook-associated protein FlgK [Telmatospirillum siberiense]
MAGLNVALSTAVSSLLLLEKQMSVTSNNISNANTTGYSKESVQVASSVTGGVGTGVTDLGTVSDVDKFLQNSVLSANTESSQASAYSSLYQDLQNALGQVTSNETGGNDISSQLGTLETALSTLSTTPSNTAQLTNVVQDLDNLTSNLRSVSSKIQQLRTSADSQISQTVDDANTQLDTINGLNNQIISAENQGQSTAALSDLRMNALKSLSSDLDVNYYVKSDGGMEVFTTSGQQLITGGSVSKLSHTSVPVSANTTYASGGINGIMVGGTDITSEISSGKLAGLIQQRDTELPNAQNALDTLSQSLSSTLNSITSQGTANPAPSTLTSATGTSFASTDKVAPSSNLTVRVAMVDSSGQVQNFQDVDLSGAATVADIVSDINTAFGSPTPPVASLNGSGQLVLSSTTSGQGIAVSTVSGSLASVSTLTDGTTTTGTSTNFGSFFHLNDVITGGSSATSISVNSSLLKNADLFPSATLNTGSTTYPYSGIGASDGSIATSLENALLASNNFTANTAVGTTAESSTTTPLGLSGSFSIDGGTSRVGVTVTSTMTLSDIAEAINTAATSAGATGVTASVVGNGNYQLQITTGGSTLTFGNISGNVISSLGLSSSPSGYLGTTSSTFSGYAASIISDVAARASNASTAATSSQTTLSTMTNNLSAQSGVNTDEEMAKLTELQNAYASSAKVVSTVQTMFNALLQAVNG